MALRFNLISLGCPKNQVDSEVMFTRLKTSGVEFTYNLDDCDVCVINTCGFIEAARKESIDVIMEVIRKREEGRPKYIVVTGCLVNNNLKSLKDELPEVDLFLSTFDEDKIVSELGIVTNKNLKSCENAGREHFNLKRTAYIKISEGCDRTCSFCTIPSIRGSYKSRSVDEIKQEAAGLAQTGVKELIVISQDTSYYGLDLNIKNGLYKLLKELVKIKGIDWIRLLYLYPSKRLFNADLISLMKNEEKILKYIDMPVQHISGNVLKLMKRGETKKDIIELIQKLKNNIRDVALRTSLITGFPGETDKDFEELLGFIKDVKFDNLGVFKYSDERGADSFKYRGKIRAGIRNERYKILMEAQRNLLPEILSKHIGRTYNAIVDGTCNRIVKARTCFQSPDIDGCTYLYLEDIKDESLQGYDGLVPVNVLKFKDYDLYANCK